MNEINSLFKPSNSNNRIWNLLKTFIQTLIFWIVFLYLIPKGILKIESTLEIIGFQAKKEIGLILFLLFSILGIYSGYTMSWIGKGTPLPLDCPNELVIQGPYKYLRNPMALAGIGQGICVGIIFGSYLIIFYSIIGAILWHITVRPIEEKDLESRFGNSYLEYKKKIRCWIPKMN
jgi:protein-S-isoprenylcysteine O-methyltransferase Ste14